MSIFRESFLELLQILVFEEVDIAIGYLFPNFPCNILFYRNCYHIHTVFPYHESTSFFFKPKINTFHFNVTHIDLYRSKVIDRKC